MSIRYSLFCFTLGALYALLLPGCASGQFKLFDKYNFDENGYRIVGIRAHHNEHPISQKLGDFYIDDKAVLNRIKNTWIFRKDGPMHACGYHYYVYLFKNNSMVSSSAINLDCREIRTSGNSFVFSETLLRDLVGQIKPLHPDRREFSSVTEAREYWARIQSDPSFVYTKRPDWIDYEGKFQFQIRCKSLDDKCGIFADTPRLQELQEEISREYPGENFALNSNGGTSNGEQFIEIRCNQSLSQKFKLYPRFNNEGFGKWDPYPLTMYAYWNTPPSN